MEDKNELNDIILNKGNTTSSNKKIILAVATLGVILVVVVMLMNSLSSSGTNNLPQAALPPKPELTDKVKPANEPLFEDVQVIEEKTSDDTNLDQIAKKLKQESIKEEEITVVPEVIKPIAKKVVKKPTQVVHKTAPKAVASGSYYIQVGSFSKYKPNKKFLKSISNLNFKYKYHKVKNLNKVLVGPFKSRQEAKNARRIIRAKVEPGAFLVKF
ncbi:MAG: SPOR domain-containing protein [Sulfurimonas sp.]